MSHNNLKFVVLAIAAVLLASSLASWQTQSAVRKRFRFDSAQLKDTKLWTQVNAKPYDISTQLDGLCRAPMREDYESERKKNPHAATFITVYVNNAGRKAMFSKEPRRFPEGSVIVKEKMGSS